MEWWKRLDLGHAKVSFLMLNSPNFRGLRKLSHAKKKKQAPSAAGFSVPAIGAAPGSRFHQQNFRCRVCVRKYENKSGS
jgi:hypothetical protein